MAAAAEFRSYLINHPYWHKQHKSSSKHEERVRQQPPRVAHLPIRPTRFAAFSISAWRCFSTSATLISKSALSGTYASPVAINRRAVRNTNDNKSLMQPCHTFGLVLHDLPKGTLLFSAFINDLYRCLYTGISAMPTKQLGERHLVAYRFSGSSGERKPGGLVQRRINETDASDTSYTADSQQHSNYLGRLNGHRGKRERVLLLK